MKKHFTSSAYLTYVASLGMLWAVCSPSARAQNVTFTAMHSFSATPGSDGERPTAGLVQGTDGNFYGTSIGGFSGFGTVFQMTPGGGVTLLYSFTGAADGGAPKAALVQGTDGNFYGTTQSGGIRNGGVTYGTIFQISPTGIFTSLYKFTGGADGANPVAALVQGSNGNFYGTAQSGGTSNKGTIFKVDGAGVVTTLYKFTGGADGKSPKAALVQGTDGNFYGTTSAGGSTNYGTVFMFDGVSSLTPLYSFTGAADGGDPEAPLVQGSDGNFYGTTSDSSISSGTHWGTIFRITPAGSFNTLYSFTGAADGYYPLAALVLGNDGNFYGTAHLGGRGANGTSVLYGTIFRVTPAGSLTTLYSFTDGLDGADPRASLALATDSNFYGTTISGGNDGSGTIFRLNVIIDPLLRPVAITRSGNDMVVAFHATAGKTYRLERKFNVTDRPWQGITGVSDLTAASTGVAQITDAGGASQTKAFYHVHLLP